jgi:peptide subunit release factor 1 (eRF1)
MQELLHQLEQREEQTGTSRISLTIPGSEDLTRVNAFLQAEIATARNIRSRV